MEEIQFNGLNQTIELVSEKKKRDGRYPRKPRLTEEEKAAKFEQYKHFITRKVQYYVGKAVKFDDNENVGYLMLGLAQSNKDEHEFSYLLMTADRDIITMPASHKFNDGNDVSANLSVSAYIWNNQRGSIVDIIKEFLVTNDSALLTRIPERKPFNKRRRNNAQRKED